MQNTDHHYLQQPGINLLFHYWGREMSAREKSSELHWPLSRIIKTVYFEKDSKLYGFVLPLTKDVNLKDISGYLGMSKREAKSLRLASKLPFMQSRENAGPFLSEVDNDLVSILLFDKVDDSPLPVDFSYPGNSKVSIHAAYYTAFDLVNSKFPEKAKLAWL